MADEKGEVGEIGKKNKGLMPLVLVLGVLLISGSGGVLFLLRARHAAKPPEKAARVKQVMHLEPFVLNTADPDQRVFLRIGIDLGLDRAPKQAEKEAAPAPTALVRDTIVMILSGTRAADVETQEGKNRLKEQIAKSLQARDPELGVREVYFTEFLVQD